MKAIIIKEFQYNRHMTSFGMVTYDSIEPNTEVRVLDGKDSDGNSIYGVDYGVCALCVLPTGKNVYIPYTYLSIVESSSDDDIDWEQRRFEMVKSIASALVASSMMLKEVNAIEYAISFSDKIISRLHSKS